MSDLLDCGGSSYDEVFDAAPALQLSTPQPHPKGVIVGMLCIVKVFICDIQKLPFKVENKFLCIAGVDAASEVISQYVQVVENPGWGSTCPICLCDLQDDMTVALSRCSHMLHLSCLNNMLTGQPCADKVWMKYKMQSIAILNS